MFLDRTKVFPLMIKNYFENIYFNNVLGKLSLGKPVYSLYLSKETTRRERTPSRKNDTHHLS